MARPKVVRIPHLAAACVHCHKAAKVLNTTNSGITDFTGLLVLADFISAHHSWIHLGAVSVAAVVCLASRIVAEL